MSLFAISCYKDIESLWNNNQIETPNLEFKRSISSRSEEVAKDISSLANAEGGVIIYGIDEANGRAVCSSGIDSGQNSERVQQIVSSSTAPEVPMTIEVISNPNDNRKEFLVVKIPKSPFYIHQVTTTGKFYVRNSTTTKQHEYNPIELKENEIALRYMARFQNRLVAESFVEKKEKLIFQTLDWEAGLALSIVPHVRIPNAIKLSPMDFRSYFVGEENSDTYDNFPTGPSAPSIDGRHSEYGSVKSSYVEIDKDRSIFFCTGRKQDVFRPMFMAGELLHLANRFMKRTNHYGGMTLRIRVIGGLDNKGQAPGVTLYQAESDFHFEHELPPAPLDLDAEFSKFFEKYFEALHVDNPIDKYSTTLREIRKLWSDYDRKARKS